MYILSIALWQQFRTEKALTKPEGADEGRMQRRFSYIITHSPHFHIENSENVDGRESYVDLPVIPPEKKTSVKQGCTSPQTTITDQAWPIGDRNKKLQQFLLELLASMLGVEGENRLEVPHERSNFRPWRRLHDSNMQDTVSLPLP